MGAIRALTASDLKNIKRDSLLKFLFFYPVILALAMRWLVPWLTDALAGRFDLHPYWPLIVAFMGLMVTPALAGYVIGFMLLDERDAGTLAALRVTPLSMNRYLAYRITGPILVGIAAAMLLVPLMNLVTIRSLILLSIVVVAALEAPIYALTLASLARNKVQGLALMKGMGVFFLAPVAAWFMAMPWQLLLGVIPTYWPAKAFWVALEGGPWLAYLGVGLIYHLVVLVALAWWFGKAVARP